MGHNKCKSKKLLDDFNGSDIDKKRTIAIKLVKKINSDGAENFYKNKIVNRQNEIIDEKFEVIVSALESLSTDVDLTSTEIWDDCQKCLMSLIDFAVNQKYSINLKMESRIASLLTLYTKTPILLKINNEKLESSVKQAVESQWGNYILQQKNETTNRILTIMGVFTAIIVIIMSLIITSASWLNNANGADIVIAFVVPNFVSIISVLLLCGLLLKQYDDNGEKWRLKKSSNPWLIAASVIMILAVLCLFWQAKCSIKADSIHTKYILSPGMYEVIQIKDDTGAVTESYIEFDVNGKKYVFPYKENVFHDGNLYFCEEHQKFE